MDQEAGAMSPRAVVIGQGYVGLPLARVMSETGIEVVGLDTSQEIVDALNAGRSHVDDIDDAAVAAMVARGYRASTDVAEIATADVVLICVPTPLGSHREPDLSAVIGAAHAIAGNLRNGTLVVLESTTYPGTTEDVLQPILESAGRVIDEDFFLAFSPERIDPGNTEFDIRNTPKIVGGVTSVSTEAAARFYGRFVDRVVRTRGAREAETAKLLENTYRHVNIALVNEMARLCAELDIDIWDVIRAASTKPFGFEAFYPGPGVGGHCIPIDPNYLSFEVKRRLGYSFRFVELAEEINDSMPVYVVERVQRELNRASKTIRGARVLLLGVTYKANISDRRESPATPIAEILAENGAEVGFHDPFVATWAVGDRELSCANDLTRAVEGADVVVLLQAHAQYAVADLAARAQIFFDTRGVTTGTSAVRL